MNAPAKNAASKYPGAVERLRRAGCPSIARMAEMLPTPAHIDKALGANSAASHWLSGRNGVTSAWELLAEKWLAENDPLAPRGVQHAQPAPAFVSGNSVVLMVVCPPGGADKVQRVVRMLGCEVEVIE